MNVLISRDAVQQLLSTIWFSLTSNEVRTLPSSETLTAVYTAESVNGRGTDEQYKQVDWVRSAIC